MNKQQRLSNLETARVLLITAMDLAQTARDKMRSAYPDVNFEENEALLFQCVDLMSKESPKESIE